MFDSGNPIKTTDTVIRDSPLLHSNRYHDHPVNHRADSDGPNRFELFLLSDGEKKVEMNEETRKCP